jgi:hypothetical protein
MPETWPLPSNVASSSGVTEARRKIRIFTTLPKVWHYGDGVPASTATEAIALTMQNEAVRAGLLSMDAFPGVNGEIRLTLYEPNYLEFTVETDGKITFIEELHGRETDYQPDLSLEETLSIIHNAGRKLWASFASSTTGTTIGLSTAFKPSPSATQEILPPSP